MRAPSPPLLAVLGASLLGCASAEPAQGGVAADACARPQASALSRVRAVIEANRSCAVDADCHEVGLRASCFDACSDVVNEVGKGAVDRAETLVEATECKAFSDAGCRLEVPPCAPHPPPRCDAGVCR